MTGKAKLILKPGREKSVGQRHPWIFSGAVAQSPDAEEGDIVEVRSAKVELLAYGFYSKKSQIVCRLFHWGVLEDDTEDVAYWKGKISRALALRSQLVIQADTNTWRLLHAEGDFLPGLIIDIYGPVAVLQVLIKGIELRLPLISQALEELGFAHQYVKAKTSSHVLEDIASASQWLKGGMPGIVEVLENGLKMEVDFEHGQKTGFFIDQRYNRALLGRYAKDKTVLNTFSYTGGFSLYALQAGAKEVHSVDVSADALAVADRNVQLNFPNAPHKSIVADCFEYLKDMPADLYDIIVLDPPAFAKHARAVPNASRGYKQINLQAFRRIRSGGLLFTFSCSQNISSELFQKIVFGAAADSGRNVRIVRQMHQPADHPVNIYHPEGEYLKGLLLYVE